MCGIAGLFHLTTPKPVDPARVERMCDAMVHRGPDGSGVWTAPGVGLGFRRLAIIDLAGSPQPMHSADGRAVLVFNGEIYNFRELRRELEAGGAKFRTQGDGEVILAAYQRWGVECLVAPHGMFAFALYDLDQRTLLLARDRLGVKPLFTARLSDGSLAFASELKALLAHPLLRREPDPQRGRGLHRPGATSPITASILQGRREAARRALPAAQARCRAARAGALVGRHLRRAAQGLGRRSRGRAAPPPAPGGDQPDDRGRAAGRVPVGRGRQLDRGRADGRGEPRAGADLFDRVRRSRARRNAVRRRRSPTLFGTDRTARAGSIADDFADDRHAWPRSSTSRSPMPRRCRRCACASWRARPSPSRSRATAPTRRSPDIAARCSIRVEEQVRSLLPRGLSPRGVRRARRALSQGRLGAAAVARQGHAAGARAERARKDTPARSRSAAPELRARLYTPTSRAQRGAYRAEQPLDRDDGAAPARSGLDRAQYADLMFWLPGDILTKVDRTSMAVSLEAREPLLDHRLVEFAATLPERLRVRGGQGKWLMKQDDAAATCPTTSSTGPSKGFVTPIAQWLRGPLAGAARAIASSAPLARSGWFDAAQIAPSRRGAHRRAQRSCARFVAIADARPGSS